VYATAKEKKIDVRDGDEEYCHCYYGCMEYTIPKGFISLPFGSWSARCHFAVVVCDETVAQRHCVHVEILEG
jgi:hypothetical protein